MLRCGHSSRATQRMWASEECKDDQGNALPKILIFARHHATSSMAEFAKALPQLRYIDVGLRLLVKTNISNGNLAKLGIKQCCYAPACVRGEAETGGNGRVARPAPQCGAGQRAYAARTCLATRVRTVRKNVDKDTGGAEAEVRTALIMCNVHDMSGSREA